MPTPPTWAALLAHWTSVAQRSVALPRTPQGDRLRAAVPHLIALQAITHSLDHADALDDQQRALGLDLAEIGIRDHAAAIDALYRPDPPPEPLAHAAREAHAALADAHALGLGWVVTGPRLLVGHPADLVAALLASGFRGDLRLPLPGTPLFPPSPCAFVRAPDDDPAPIDDHTLAAIGLFLGQHERLCRGPLRSRPAQVHRQFDFAKGGPIRDLVAPWGETRPGLPILIPAIDRGQSLPVPPAPRHGRPIEPLPVEFDLDPP